MGQLRELVNLFGVIGALAFIAIVLGAVLLALLMILHFGETSFHDLAVFVREMFVALRYEPRKAHPAIRLELHFHRFFGAAFLLCLGATVLHALFPWMRKAVEDAVYVSLIGSFILLILLSLVSMGLSLRER